MNGETNDVRRMRAESVRHRERVARFLDNGAQRELEARAARAAGHDPLSDALFAHFEAAGIIPTDAQVWAARARFELGGVLSTLAQGRAA